MQYNNNSGGRSTNNGEVKIENLEITKKEKKKKSPISTH